MSQIHTLRALGIAAGLGLAILGSWGMRFDFPRPDFQPKNAAFGIWGVIYAALGVTIAASLLGHGSDAVAALVCASLVCCGVWARVVQSRRVLAAVFICAAAALAIAATALARVTDVGSLAIATGPGLLAGWLSLAAVLGVVLAVGKSARTSKLTPWLLVPPVTAALVAGVGAGNAAPAAAVLWAAAFSPRTGPTLALAILGLLGAVGATWRATALWE